MDTSYGTMLYDDCVFHSFNFSEKRDQGLLSELNRGVHLSVNQGRPLQIGDQGAGHDLDPAQRLPRNL